MKTFLKPTACYGLCVSVLALFLHWTPVSRAAGRIELTFIDGVLATALSGDGSVVVGNTVGAFETFRWTESTGVELLGRATVPVIGVGAGTPDVSRDGTRISATIIDSTNTYATQGLWTQGSGWQETMPPIPPTGGILDNSYGSAWGLSGDGLTLTGLYWRPGQSGGLAHASAWTEVGGLVDLGSSGRSSRANHANYDGSVIVGWDENPTFANWRATVWVNGVLQTLSASDAFTEATHVNLDGTRIVGQDWDDSISGLVAAMWEWDGSSWQRQVLGTLPGTVPGFGGAIASSATEDGQMVVGFNRFTNSPSGTGFIWTPTDGMQTVPNFLAAGNITLPPNYAISSVTAVSENGKVIAGVGQETTFPFEPSSFLIRIVNGDFDGDGQYTCHDVDALVAAIVSGGNSSSFDLNGDGLVNQLDLSLWLAEAGAAQLPSGNPYLVGDANLDGIVDGQDFLVWNANKFSVNAAWCQGDFNADGVIDGSDFVLWNANKFMQADGTIAVPEPAAWSLFLGLAAIAICRRHRRGIEY